MKTFKDMNGKEYAIQLTIGTVKKLRDTINFDLLNLIPSEGANKHVVLELYDDDVLTAQVVYNTLSDEMKGGATEEEFINKIDGECIASIKDALLEEIKNFFLKSKRRELVDAMKKFSELQKEMKANQLKMVTELDVKEAAGSLFMNSLESSE